MKQFMKTEKVKLSELCFYIFFSSLLFAKGIGLYDGQTAFKCFLLVALAAWAGKFLLESYHVGELLLHLLLIALGGVIYLASGEKGALLVILLLLGTKGMKLERVFKAGAVVWSVAFGSLFLLTSLHLVDSAFKVHDRLHLGRIIRWNLGYAHPNVLHISYLTLVCFLIWLLQKRFRFFYLVLLEIGNLYVFMYSLSSTGFLATTICLILVGYWNLRKKFCGLEKGLIQLCLPLCLFLSIGAPLLLQGKAFDVVNGLLNTRLELSKWFLENQQVQLFGVRTSEIVTAHRTMDNSYVFALITYGIIFSLLAVYGYMRTIYRRTKEQDGIALCIILTCLIAGLTEPFLFNTSFKNVSLLIIGAELFAKESQQGERMLTLGINREIRIPLPDFGKWHFDIQIKTKPYRVKLLAVSIAAALPVAGIVFLTASFPERYLLPRKAFEYTDDLEESYYLTSPSDIQKEGDCVLGYESEQTEMVAFKGNIAKVERFRNTIAGGCVTAVFVLAAGSIGIWFRKKKE